MVNGVYAHATQPFGKLGQRVGHEAGWNYDGIRGTKIEGLIGGPLSRGWCAPQKVLHNLEKSLAQFRDRRELPYVHASQSFRQTGFIASRQRPVGEVVGEAFSDKVMLLQGSKTVLKD